MISAVLNQQYDKKNQGINFKSNTTQSIWRETAGLAADTISKGINKIETGGILVDFLFVDFLGTVAPRTYLAYNRNKEELGHLNYKAGNEEVIRELLSGPSMFVVPLALIKLSKHVFGSASNIQFDTLNSITHSFKNTVKTSSNTEDRTKLKEDFYRDVFNGAFENHSTPDKKEAVEKLVNHLTVGEATKKLDKAAVKQIVSDLNKSNSLHLTNSHNVTLKDGFTKNVGDLATDLINYSKDVVTSISKKASSVVSKDSLPEILEDLHKARTNGRKLTIAATILATGAFLYTIPILYQRNKTYPGVEGLKNPVHSKFNRSQSFTANDDVFKAFTGKKEEEKKKVAFTGSGDFLKKLEYKGANVPHALLLFYTLGLMLIPRTLRARDKDERREIITRDAIGLPVLTLALPISRNFIATAARKISGLPISSKLASGVENIKNHLNPKNGVGLLSFENIEDIYSGVSKYKNCIVDFSENIHSLGGNLSKLFGHLSKDSKNALLQVSTALGQNKIPSKNEDIIELLKNAKENTSLKQHVQTIVTELESKDNNLIKIARRLKSLPEAASIIGVSGFLGWYINIFNINKTKKLHETK